MPQPTPGIFIALYTDEDVTSALAPALRWRGYVAQSTLEADNREMSDEAQLFYAAQHGMAILTYNARDFVSLARDWYFAGREHAGIVVSEQFGRQHFGELLRQVLRLLDNLTAEELHNRVIHLQRFR